MSIDEIRHINLDDVELQARRMRAKYIASFFRRRTR